MGKNLEIAVEAHPLLAVSSFLIELPVPLGQIPSPDWLLALLRLDAPAPLKSSDALRQAIRDMLRHGGFKPAGRSKPASEYLIRAATEAGGGFGSINAVVDVCNVVSLHSGMPIGLTDPDLAKPPFRIGIAAAGSSYVFNASGQSMELDGLVCLHDTLGPCANAVKDAQRTKTTADTRRVLTVMWGAKSVKDHLHAATAWYHALCLRIGAQVADVTLHTQ